MKGCGYAQWAGLLVVLGAAGASPVFSESPPQDVFICQTEANGLGPAIDRDCNARTRVTYYYKSTTAPASTGYDAMVASFSPGPDGLDAGFRSYDPAGAVPADVARIRTAAGCEANYIVRREVGTINRAVYDIQFLHQPGDVLPSPRTRAGCGWNGRLVYLFGGGRGAGYHQGVLAPAGRAQEVLLSQGYAVATSTLNAWETNGNDRVSVETLARVKAHFSEEYGRPVHTIGWGSSGGALQQYLIAQNSPGLLDGIIPSLSFPDWMTSAPFITDCSLLDNFFERSGAGWTEEQKTAVSGFATWRTCMGWQRAWTLVDARSYCDSSVPRTLIYDPARNPSGIRCDYYSTLRSVLGIDARSGVVRRPLDNVGVQYGLAAFNDGTIDAEQFLALNEDIGGFDVDGRIGPHRTEASLESVRAAYEGGSVLTGGGGLRDTPIIDWRQYTDDSADVHDSVRSLVTRARLIAANGSADNQIILADPRPDPYPPDTRFVERQRELVLLMDEWLTRIAADRTGGTRLTKIVRNKPELLTDGCWATDGERFAERTAERRVDDASLTATLPALLPDDHAAESDRTKCHELYPTHADPRMVAGGPLTGDVLKCVLKPIDPADYARPLTAHQLTRLKAIFPSGICDFTRPGIAQPTKTLAPASASKAQNQTLSAARRLRASSFTVSFPKSLRKTAVNGRLFILISRTNTPEVRLQGHWINSPMMVATDVKDMRPNQKVRIDDPIRGYPFHTLANLPPGDYFVQSILNIYTEFHRADGHIIHAHMDQWEGQQFNKSPGNLISKVVRLHLDPSKGYDVELNLSEVIPRMQAPEDTQWVKRIRIQSNLLSQFWGHPIYLGAVILLPRDYAHDTTTRYPVIYHQQGHFTHEAPFGFRTAEVAEKEWDRRERESAGFETGYAFHQAWTSDDFPRVIAVSFQHPTPFADMSGLVNSVNNGPYGDAVMTELIPHIEEQFRIIRQPYARTLAGRASGGRDALTLQVRHPEFFGGAWVFQPWAFNFQRYFTLNIYENDNAFVVPPKDLPEWARSEWSWRPIERYLVQTRDGIPIASIRQLSAHDAVLATHAGGEFGTDDAILGPIGADGYPRPLWDRITGQIDREVANYWREHGDLAYYVEKNWSTIGASLIGKLHLYAGDKDHFQRDQGVRLFEEFLQRTRNPHYAGTFGYGALKSDFQPMTNEELVRRIADHIARNRRAPGDGG